MRITPSEIRIDPFMAFECPYCGNWIEIEVDFNKYLKSFCYCPVCTDELIITVSFPEKNAEKVENVTIECE